MEDLATTYTSNQTGAIATLLAVALWGLTALGVAIRLEAQTATGLTVFSILIIIAWILVPLYVWRVRWAYIVGILTGVTAMGGLLAMPGTPAWYSFTHPVYHFSYIVFYLLMLASIYFAYKSYQELATAPT